MNISILKTIIALLFVVSVLALAACQDAEVPEEQSVAEIEYSDDEQGHEQEPQAEVETEQLADPVVAESDEELKPYDLNDPSSWGEPTGFDSDGMPTGYRRVMPNGHVRTAMPFHGERNTAIEADATTDSKDAEYQHWHHRDMTNPLQVFSCVTGPWAGSVSKYISAWNQSPFVSMIVQPHPQGLTGLDCFDNEVPGAITITNFDFSDRWPGDDLTEYGGHAWGDNDPDGHMTYSLIALNDGKEWFNPELTAAEEVAAWRDMTVCHELGHALGLGHNDEDKSTATGTCMDYSRTPFPNLNPDAHDFEHIAEAYNHTHGGMGTSCKLGEAMEQEESSVFYGVVSANDFFNKPQAPERKTTGGWVAVKKWSGSEIGSMISVDQSRPALFDEQEYFVHDETSTHGYGIIDPGPDHTYFEAFASLAEVQKLLDEHIEQHTTIGLLEDCENWEVRLSDLLWDTSLEYFLQNSPERRAKEQEVQEAERNK